MILISHRGNLNGPSPDSENKIDSIDLAISLGYDVEIDAWYIDNQLYLGHDNPQYKIDFRWMRDRLSKLWIHCKNIEAVIFFSECEYDFNYFWHENDTITLTSTKKIWAFPGKQPIKNSIAVMPELFKDDISKCLGICSDYISNYK